MGGEITLVPGTVIDILLVKEATLEKDKPRIVLSSLSREEKGLSSVPKSSTVKSINGYKERETATSRADSSNWTFILDVLAPLSVLLASKYGWPWTRLDVTNGHKGYMWCNSQQVAVDNYSRKDTLTSVQSHWTFHFGHFSPSTRSTCRTGSRASVDTLGGTWYIYACKCLCVLIKVGQGCRRVKNRPLTPGRVKNHPWPWSVEGAIVTWQWEEHFWHFFSSVLL